MIVIFYYYPLRGRETRREDPEDRRTDDLRGTHGRRSGITKEEGECEKKGLLTDDKEREREKGDRKRKPKRRTKKQFARKSLLPARATIVRA